MSNLILAAPLRGWCAPLDETPDAVFAQRLLGDGVAIDPTGDTLHAPCDGEVISVAASKHAIAIRATNGAEILHARRHRYGCAGGEGFQALVAAGRARAAAAMPLLQLRSRRARAAREESDHADRDHQRRALLDRAVRSADRSVDVGDVADRAAAGRSGWTVPARQRAQRKSSETLDDCRTSTAFTRGRPR